MGVAIDIVINFITMMIFIMMMLMMMMLMMMIVMLMMIRRRRRWNRRKRRVMMMTMARNLTNFLQACLFARQFPEKPLLVWQKFWKVFFNFTLHLTNNHTSF